MWKPSKRPCTGKALKIKMQKAVWSATHKEEIDARSREFYLKNKDRLKSKFRNRNYILKHGITLKEAELMLENQNNKCLICSDPIVFGGSLGAHLDHDHINNKIRGVLCHNCNKGLGQFKDNISNLFSAINYLRFYKVKEKKVG